MSICREYLARMFRLSEDGSPSLGFRASGFRTQGVWGLGFRVSGLGFRGFGVEAFRALGSALAKKQIP